MAVYHQGALASLLIAFYVFNVRDTQVQTDTCTHTHTHIKGKLSLTERLCEPNDHLLPIVNYDHDEVEGWFA